MRSFDCHERPKTNSRCQLPAKGGLAAVHLETTRGRAPPNDKSINIFSDVLLAQLGANICARCVTSPQCHTEHCSPQPTHFCLSPGTISKRNWRGRSRAAASFRDQLRWRVNLPETIALLARLRMTVSQVLSGNGPRGAWVRRRAGATAFDFSPRSFR
jgi:hypothetical protein